MNKQVRDLYVQHLLPGIAAEGDDNNHGSSAMYDVLVLQVRLCLPLFASQVLSIDESCIPVFNKLCIPAISAYMEMSDRFQTHLADNCCVKFANICE